MSGTDDQVPAEVPLRRAPRLSRYLLLNLGVWAFLAFQGWILTMALGSSRQIVFLSVVLGIGFLGVSIFDFLWLRFRRPE